jgi:hypothetical protein
MRFMDLIMFYDFIQVLHNKRRHPTKIIIFLSINNFYVLFITKTEIKA